MIRTMLVGLLLLFSCSSHAGEQFHICRYCNSSAGHLAEDEAYTPGDRKYAPPRQVDLIHLKLDVTPNFAERSVSGTATLEIAPIGTPLKELQLDAVDLNVKAVRSTVAIADYTSSREHLTITFAEALPVGERCVLEIEYSAEPRQGLYFRTPELGYPAEDTHLFTQGEPQLGRHWFPCHDYPNERCTTEIVCHVPAAMTVLSNGRLLGEAIDGDTKAVHWRQDKPHVCYLITLVAGHFAKLEDLNRPVPLAFYSQPTVQQYAANSFAYTADIMDFFNQEIGLAYPWNKYYQVTVRDFQFGGMENTTMTTLAHRTISTPASGEVKGCRIRKLDAHEMAHQWFGDYVTCKDWSHIWLNEGFATYYSHLYEGHKFGRDALLYDLYFDATEKVLPQHKDLRPIVYRQYQRPIDQFDFRAYPKGSWVLHMLRSQLGDDLFRQAIRTYLQRHAFTSVTTPDLVKVLEEVSGRSLDKFFDQWVFHPGHPKLKLKYKWLADKQLAHVSLEQTHEANGQVLLFELPSKLRFWVDGQVVDHPIEVFDEKHDFYVPLAEQPTAVRFDPEYTVLADVDFDKTDKLWLAQLANRNDMIGQIFAVHALAKRKTRDSITAVGETLRSDSFFGVRIQAAKALGKAKTDEALAELLTGLDVENPRVRLAVVEAIGKFFSREAEQALVEVVQTDANPEIVAEATRSLGKYRSDAAQALLRRQLASESFRNELAVSAIEAIGQQQDAALHSELMQMLATRGTDLTSWGLGEGLKHLAEICRELADDAAQGEVEAFVRGYVEHPQENVQVAAIEALGLLADNRSRAVLAGLADDESTDRLARAAVAALKQFDKRAPLVPKELSELRKLVDELQDESQKLRKELDALKDQDEAAEKATGK